MFAREGVKRRGMSAVTRDAEIQREGQMSARSDHSNANEEMVVYCIQTSMVLYGDKLPLPRAPYKHLFNSPFNIVPFVQALRFSFHGPNTYCPGIPLRN